MGALPIIVADGNVIKFGGYPTLAEVEIALKENAE
jgi:hypothetical protein